MEEAGRLTVDLDALVNAARTHCQSLDAAVRKETLVAGEVEQGLHRFSVDLAAQTQQLQTALAGARNHTDRFNQASSERTSRLHTFLHDTQTQVEALESQLRTDLESLPGVLSQLREQATQAAPRLAQNAQLLHTRVDELTAGVESLMADLGQELERVEQEVKALQQATQDQRMALDKELASCLASGEKLHKEGRAASESLTQKMGSAEKDLRVHAAHTEESLHEAGRTAHATVLEGQQELALRLTRDAQKVQQSVQDLHSSCRQAGQHTVEQSLTLRGSLGTLCQALEPLVRVQQEARRTGAV